MHRIFNTRRTEYSNAGHTRTLMLAAVILLVCSTITPNVAAQLRATEVAANTVTLTWTAPGDDGNTGTAALYDLRYSRVPLTAANWSDWSVVVAAQNEPIPSPAGTIQSYVVSNLQEGTTYYFAIRAGDEAGNWSVMSNVVSANTSSESIPPAAINDLHIIETNVNSLTLAWTAPGDDDLVGTAAAYEMRRSTSPITLANWSSAAVVSGLPTPAAPGTVQSVTVSGLTSGTTYYFAIRTRDEVPNWSPLSNVLSAVPGGADNTAPGQVTDLQADPM